MPSSSEMAVRAYIAPEEDSYTFSQYEEQQHLFDRILVFDTETTTDRFQNLKFGSFKIYEHNNTLRYQGVFYHPKHIRKEELFVLADYSKKKDTQVMTVEEFVDAVFLPEAYDLKTLIVGFNLPFDLSRLAKNFGYARNGMRGGFSFKLSNNNKKYPRLVIKHIDSTKAFIRFGSSLDENKRELGFRGNFLDLHTLVHALTGENHSLASACRALGSDVPKMHTEHHGRITAEYIEYNLQDVDATYALYLRAQEEFSLYELDIPVTKAYSSASIGKALFKKMGISAFLQKNNNNNHDKKAAVNNEVLGYATTTYFGGRSEVKIRKTPTQCTVLDFLSMYPTLCILMNLWDFITCDHIEVQECTDEVRRFVDEVQLDDLRRKETLAQMNAIVQIEPCGDILPVRCRFGDKHKDKNNNTYNIGDCHVTSGNPEIRPWYALPDVVNSKLRTGKTPKIIRAIRFVPVGKQEEMQPVTLFDKTVDPYKDNLFKVIIEQRKQLQKQYKEECSEDSSRKTLLDKKQKALKIIANATSYGIFMEINTQDKKADVQAYGLHSIQCHVSKVEEFGKQANSIVATLITSGARLILGITETILAKHGAVHVFCDTDSMAVPPQYVKEVQEFFGALNPYDFDALLFKVEEYEDEHGQKHSLENVWCYGISAKRYALYKQDKATGKIEILKASSHGLGHLLNPFSRKDGDDNNHDWHKEIWLDVLKLHYGQTTAASLNEKYSRSYALAKLAISTPQIMKRFDRLNKGKPYGRQIKPFNFCIVGIGNDVDGQTGKPVKPLAPYRKNAQQCPYDSFIDYESGKEMKGLQYWKPFVDVFWDYVKHLEAKFDGNVGVLSRKHITVGSVVHIGKESNNLEQAEVLGVQDDDYVVYGSSAEQLLSNKEGILLAEPKDVKKFGISQRTLYNVKRSLTPTQIPKLSKKTRECLLAYIHTLSVGST